ncbi:SpaA isopeptide-forming pilin-related protein [Furfurilactobacillus milii]|uniref:SpaA isopeptide-forming pilin-related protein n=1 Tax=Furfurilactobacillus milii TaxID=2888272 RepID=UPI00136A891B|nr:SpaA isopeptide-forming pilin-related protein [Furfurilactobacillus milii]
MRKRLYALAGAVIASAFFSVTTVKTISAEADTTPAVAATSSTVGSQPSASSSGATTNDKQNTNGTANAQSSSAVDTSTKASESSESSSFTASTPTSTSPSQVSSSSATSSSNAASNTDSSKVANTASSSVDSDQTQTTPRTDSSNASSTAPAATSTSASTSANTNPDAAGSESGGVSPGNTGEQNSSSSKTQSDATSDQTDSNSKGNTATAAVTQPREKYDHGDNKSADDPTANSNAINDSNTDTEHGTHDFGTYLLDEDGVDGSKASQNDKAAKLNIKFGLTFSNGKSTSTVNSGKVTINSDVHGTMTFLIPNEIWKYLVTGDTFTYQLPNGYKIVDAQSGDIKNDNAPDGSTTYGRYTIGTDGKISLTFYNPHVTGEAGDNPIQYLKGQMTFDALFNKDVIEKPGQPGDSLTLPGKNDTDKITIHPAVKQSISKSGQLDKHLDPDKVTWSVYMNRDMQTLTNAQIIETFDSQVTYNQASPVKIYSVQEDLNGHIVRDVNGQDVLGKQLIEGTDYTVDEKGNVKFLHPINSVYKLVYVTDINKPKDSKGNIRTATLNLTNNVDQTAKEQGTTKIHASTTLNAHYEGLFYKIGPKTLDAEHHIYSWTVGFNHGQDTLTGDKLTYTDVVVKPQTFVPGSLAIVLMTYHQNAKNADDMYTPSNTYLVPGTDYTLTTSTDDSGFVVTFLGKNFHSPVNLVYKTQIDQHQKVISTEDKAVEIINKAEVKGYDTQQPEPQPAESFDLVKNHTDIDVGFKTIRWNIDINKSNYQLNNYVLTDNADNGGLSLPFTSIQDALNSNNANAKPAIVLKDTTTGDVLLEGRDYKLTTLVTTKHDAVKGDIKYANFTVEFLGKYTQTSDQFNINYYTLYDVAHVTTPVPDKQNTFANTVDATWKDVNKNDIHDHATTDYQAKDEEAYQGKKGGAYDPITKEIHWNIVSNYDTENYDHYYLMDPIQGNQQLLPNSITITQGSIGGNGQFNPGIKNPPYAQLKIYHGKYDPTTGLFHVDSIMDKATGKFNSTTSVSDLDFTKYLNYNNAGPGYYNYSLLNATEVMYIDFGTAENPLPKLTDANNDNRTQMAFQIEYQTSVDGIQVTNKYNNDAFTHYSDTPGGRLTVHADVETYVGNAYISKQGQAPVDIKKDNRATWTIDINRSQSTINNAVFSDTPSENQRIDPNTIHIYETILKTVTTSTEGGSQGKYNVYDNSVGDVTKANNGTVRQTILNPDLTKELKGVQIFKDFDTLSDQDKQDLISKGYAYTFEIQHDLGSGQETLKINFLKTIGRAYVLQYQSRLYFNYANTKDGKTNFTNNANLNGQNVTPGNPGDTDADSFNVTKSQASAIGYFYDLHLTKEVTGGKLLEGIIFNLYEKDTMGNLNLIRTATTDKNGLVVFKNIPGYHLDKSAIQYYIQEMNPSKNYITPVDLDGSWMKFEDPDGTKNLVNHPDVSHTMRNISVDMLDGDVTNQIQTGTIWNHLGSATLTKTDDQGNALEGAHFNFQVSNDGKTWTDYTDSSNRNYRDLITDAKGTITVDGLLPNYYRFKETQAPDGYILNKTDPQSKEIIIPKSDGDNSFADEQKITVFDTQSNSKGTVLFYKIGSKGSQNNAPIAGAEFKLYYLDSKGNSVYVGDENGDVISDVDGLVRFTNLNAGWHYCVREVYSPNGYYNPDKNHDIYQFTVSGESNNGRFDLIEPNVINYTDHVVLTKVGNDNSKVVGATFILKDASGKVIKTLTTDANGKQTSNDVWTTDGNGQIVIDNLTAGDYTLQEVAAPAGYILNSTIQKFTISAKLDSTFYFTLTDYRGQIQITKVDGDNTSKKLSGVVYTLTGNGSTQTATTDANGIATFKNLSSGDYTVVETHSLNGYIRDTKVYKFTISADVTSDDKSLYDLSATYKNYQNTVTFTKFLNSSIGAKGAGAVYELNGAGESKQFTTDANGLITFTGLKTGSYTLTELTAPMGYATNNTPLTFTVDADGNISVASLSQIEYQGHAQLTKAGANGPLQGVKFDLLDADQKTVEQANLITDANGVITTKDLKPGTYYFVEKQTLSGYILDTTPIKVAIEDRKGQNDAWLDDSAKATLTNVQNKLVFTKHNAKNDLLDGAVYELTNNTTKAVTKYTTVHGQITMNGLAAGNYTMSEFTAPFGYATNDTPLTFTVDDNGHISVTSLSQTDYQGHAQLTKTGANGPLQGVTFDLLDADEKTVEQANLITDANGVITTKDLKPGTYYFVERKTSSGYILDARPQKVVVDDRQGQTAAWLDDSAKAILTNVQNQLIFTKYNVKHELLDGAVYELTNNTTKEARQYTTLNGQFTMIGLAVGNYTLAEITAPTGYATNGISMTFAVNEDGQVSVASLSQIDYQGHAQLTKIGANGPLQGVTFDLLDADQKTVEQANLITDANGVITTKDLKPGTYYFVEKQTLSGYILDTMPIKVVIDDRKGQNATWLDESAKATLANVQNKLVFTKYGTHVGNVLDGAEYTLVNSTTGDKPAFTLVNGEVSLSGLAAGTYTITEITAPKGYMLNPDVISFTVDEKGLINGKSELSLNQIDYQGYAFMKKVSADTKVPLAGAIFSVYNSEGKIVQTITTGTDGLVKTKFLPVGDYYFREMKAPDGYILNSNLVHFSINKSNHDVALDEGTFVNWLGAVKMTKYGQPDVTNIGTRVMLPGTKFALYYVVDDGSEELYGIDPNNEHNIHYFKAGEDTKGWTTVFTTNVNGQIFLQGLKPGNYYFKEVAHADGYILRDDTPDLKPELSKGLGSANFVDKPQGLEFSRVDGTSAVVDKNGHVTSAPDDRDFSSRLYFVILPASNVESVTFAGDQTNYQGLMTFTKTNSKGDKLAGAVYQLLDSDKKAVEVTMDGKQVSQLTTDANGNFTITGLAPGTYYLKEITAPDGYLINDNVDETRFVIADTTRGGQSNVTASQIDYQGSIKLTKVAAEDGHVLANATFELLDADKNVIKTGLTTDANGTLTVTDLKPGTYYFKETVAPTGYQLSTELLKVVVLDHATDEPVAVSTKFQDAQVPPVTPPTTPNIPNIPTTPTTPNVPNIPNTPTTPNVPNIPNVPTTPGQPNIPNVPTTPEVPNVPTTPTVPNVPVMPNVPNKPMTPTMPNQPARPAKPETPIVSAENGSYEAAAVTPVASQKLVANGRPAGQPAKQEGHGVTGLPETGEKSASLLAMLGLVLLSVIAGFAYYVRKQEA